jgi:FkbM family methyltransferase
LDRPTATLRRHCEGKCVLRESLFGLFAACFPTERIGTNKLLAALWRVIYFGLAPRRPFVMRTRHYRLMAHPQKGTLTRAVIRRGHWEPQETDAFIGCLQPGAFIVDVGANFGHYAMVASKFTGPDGLVVAFEPHRATFALLQENCALQACQNIKPVQAGVAAENGELALTGDTANPGGHSFVAANVYGHGDTEHVPVHALDSYLTDHHPGRKLDVIKIDVQGLEGQVIRGAAETIERDRPILFIEISPVPMRNAGEDYRDLLHFFEQQRYTVHLLDQTDGRLMRVDYAEAEKRLANPAIEYLDCVFKPDAP